MGDFLGKAIRAVVTEIPLLIMELRQQRVILDEDLARLYGVTTKALKQAVKRNLARFPSDFAYQIENKEVAILRSQVVTSRSWGGARYLPMVFTEHGVVMAANILRSPRAIRMSIEVVRAFVRLRQFAMTHRELAERMDEMERKYDKQFHVVFDAIRALMEPPEDEQKAPVGFHTELGEVDKRTGSLATKRARKRVVAAS